MRGIVTRGIVLGRTNYKEADRILSILTPDNGKISVIAKGVRKSKSKLAGGVELFSTSFITFIPPKKEIGTLISSRLDSHFGNIVKDIDRTTYAYQVLKLINKLTESNAGPEYFEITKDTLEAINTTEVDIDVVKLWFNMQVLKTTGHTPNLKTDTSGHGLKTKTNYSFSIEDMTFVASGAGTYQASHIKLLRLALGASTPTMLIQVLDINSVLPSCLQLASAMVRQHIGT